jgi:hypothetical protein
MKKITIKDLDIIYENGVARLNANFENSDTPFSELEIKNFMAAILHCLTNVGDGYGNPIIDNIQIRANSIVGQQKTL